MVVGGMGARLIEYDGSMFELRAVIEPFVCSDAPTECMIVYLPGCERDRHGSVLMELEKSRRLLRAPVEAARAQRPASTLHRRRD